MVCQLPMIVITVTFSHAVYVNKKKLNVYFIKTILKSSHYCKYAEEKDIFPVVRIQDKIVSPLAVVIVHGIVPQNKPATCTCSVASGVASTEQTKT